MTHLAVPGLEGAHALAFLLGWGGGELPVYVNGRFVCAIDVRDARGLWEFAERQEQERNAQVELGLPQGEPTASVLWAWTSGRGQLGRAASFRPPATMVLRFGQSADRLMLWGLREQIPVWELEKHNERISYCLHAARTRCAPEKLRIPLPGTFLRLERSRPAPVLVTRLTAEAAYLRSQVTARLKEPPPRDAWRERR